MTLKRFFGVAAVIEEAFTSVLILAIVALVFIAAITRYFGTPINWSVDIAQALFVWVVFVGANQAMRASGHVGVSILVDRLPQKTRTMIEIAVNMLVAVFLLAIVVYGIQLSIISYKRILQSIPVSYSFVTGAVPVGALLMFFTTLVRIGTGVHMLRHGMVNDDLTHDTTSLRP